MPKTKIQWTEQTLNPIAPKEGGWWCHKVAGDPACANCYAAEMNQNTSRGGNQLPFHGKPPELELKRQRLDEFSRKTKPSLWFWGSMTDLFGEWVPEEWVQECLDAAHSNPRQQSLFLTKRIDRAYHSIMRWLDRHPKETALPQHIGIGTTVGNQRWANYRLPWLVAIPARFRFVSFEPIVNGDKSLHLPPAFKCPPDLQPVLWGTQGKDWLVNVFPPHKLIHWALLGGESGAIRKVRPYYLEHAEALMKTLQDAGVPVFHKQLGRYPIAPDFARMFPDLPASRIAEIEQAYCRQWPEGTHFGNQKTGAYYRKLNGRHVILPDKKGGDITQWAPRYQVREYPDHLAPFFQQQTLTKANFN